MKNMQLSSFEKLKFDLIDSLGHLAKLCDWTADDVLGEVLCGKHDDFIREQGNLFPSVLLLREAVIGLAVKNRAKEK